MDKLTLYEINGSFARTSRIKNFAVFENKVYLADGLDNAVKKAVADGLITSRKDTGLLYGIKILGAAK